MSEEAKAEPLETEQPASEAAEAPEPARAERAELFTPELLTTLWKVVPAAWLLGAIATGVALGVQVAFLVVAAGVLTLVITLMWTSVQSLTGGASIGFEEALGMGAPSKVEEEKRAVLRALKDLEYERSVGKISPEDYAELSARYRSEAKRLIQSVDEALGPAREEVESAIVQRLTRAGLAPPEDRTAEPAVQPATMSAASAEEADKKPNKPAKTQPDPPETEP